ncbi:MAG: signal peptidase II [Deltaproteobacteria bacterium]|nr:signal peptidase II [Deltaproteobacteria bacterium]
MFKVKKSSPFFILISITILALDQISKCIIIHTVPQYGFLQVINGFFNIVHVRNRGMVFGIMNSPEVSFGFYVLVIATLITVILLLYWFTKLKEDEWHLRLGLSLILGGAFGNLIDRLRLREVIDFLDFFIGPYHWPAFNIADTALTVGTFWMAVSLLFFKKQV